MTDGKVRADTECGGEREEKREREELMECGGVV